jgi:hypothetical protein
MELLGLRRWAGFNGYGREIEARSEEATVDTFKDVFPRAAVLGRATVSKQFGGYGWNHQQEHRQRCGEAKHFRWQENWSGSYQSEVDLATGDQSARNPHWLGTKHIRQSGASCTYL